MYICSEILQGQRDYVVFLYATGKEITNEIGKKDIKKLFPTWSSMPRISYHLLNDITNKTLNKVID